MSMLKIGIIFMLVLIEIGLILPLATSNSLPYFLNNSQVFGFMIIGGNLLILLLILTELI